MRLNDSDLFWYVALVGVSVVALAFGYLIDIVVGAVFWTIATLILLAVRPY